MTSMKMRARLPLGLFTALTILLGLIAIPGKSSAIEPNNCINPWSVNKPANDPTRDWHDILGLKDSTYMTCHSCYDGVDEATGEGYTHCPTNKSSVVSNVGIACMTQEQCKLYRDNASLIKVSWIMDLDENKAECKEADGTIKIDEECLDAQDTIFSFMGNDIVNPKVTTLEPFYKGSEICFPTHPDYPNSCQPTNRPNHGLPKTIKELYEAYGMPVPDGIDPNFNPQTAPYVSFTGIIPPMGKKVEGQVHAWRIFFTMEKTDKGGKRIDNVIAPFMPTMMPGEPQESITDFTLVKYVNPNLNL